MYDHGKPCFYSLLELEPSRTAWEPAHWTFGDCEFRHEQSGATTTLQANINLPVPGGSQRLRGNFKIRGPAMQLARPGSTSPSEHVWTPIVGPAQAEVELRIGEASLLKTRGTGYHDRNGSAVPLDGLGIHHWTWGRQVIGDRLLIYYLTWPEDPFEQPLFLAYEINASGVMRPVEIVEVELGRCHVGRFGMPWWDRITIHGHERPLVIHVDPPVDDGPFYLRSTTRASVGGLTARGWTELCRPKRIDRAPLRPLVQMSVQRERGDNSMWLPLFVGTRHDRLRRLASWWRGDPAGQRS